MGLDMHLFRLRKPEKSSEELSEKTADELANAGYTVFLEKQLPDDFDLIRNLTTPVNIDVDYVDIQKIRTDYNIPKDAPIVGESYSSGNVGYSFRISKTESRHIDIPMDKLKAEYIFAKKTQGFCVECEEVAYWRKYYDLQDELYEASPVAIQNCGYYPLTDDMWDAIKKFDKDTYYRLLEYRGNDTDGVIVYHEWY